MPILLKMDKHLVKKNGIYGSILRILRLMLEQQMKDMIIKDGGDMIHYQNLNQ